LKLNKVSLPKVISKCCELVKLRHVKDSGPVFLRHSVDIELHDNLI